jgi:hypothetical protein
VPNLLLVVTERHGCCGSYESALQIGAEQQRNMKQSEASRFTVAQGEIEIQPASLAETAVVAAILCEAAVWLEQRGMPLWQASAFEPDHLMPDVADGQYMLARWHGSPAGVFKYQREDPQRLCRRPISCRAVSDPAMTTTE